MNRAKLLRIVTVLSIVGVFALFFISEFQEYPVREVCDLEVGERVRVLGYANDISSYSNVTFFVIEDANCSVDGIIFEEVDFDEGEYLFEGKVEYYKGEKEVIVDKILR